MDSPYRATARDAHSLSLSCILVLFGFSYLPVVAGARTNLTANRNWMAHTSRQHRFNDSERAHSASVTSQTIAQSSKTAGPTVGGGGSRPPGEIFNKNINDNKANKRDTEIRRKQRKERLNQSIFELLFMFSLFPNAIILIFIYSGHRLLGKLYRICTEIMLQLSVVISQSIMHWAAIVGFYSMKQKYTISQDVLLVVEQVRLFIFVKLSQTTSCMDYRTSTLRKLQPKQPQVANRAAPESY